MNEIFLDSVSFGPIRFASKDTLAPPCKGKTEESRMPIPFRVQEDGSITFSLYYPNAKEVTLRFVQDSVTLTAGGNGIWTGRAEHLSGFQAVQVLVDNNEVLSPLLPIGFAGNLPYNFVDIPSDGSRAVREIPHGSICQEFVKNSVTGLWERVQVYLPPQYHSEPHQQFPVLYLQHGYGENETVWLNQGKINFLLDNLIAEGKVRPFAVVMCCGMMVSEDGSRTDYDRFHHFLLGDVMPLFEKQYRIGKSRENRAMAGLSMGSIQTSRTAVLHPDQFHSIGLFSGFFRDILGDDLRYLSTEKLSAFRSANVRFFRAMGTEDPYFSAFEADDKLLDEYAIPCFRRTYAGTHEWNVWRKCIEDFSQYEFGISQ